MNDLKSILQTENVDQRADDLKQKDNELVINEVNNVEEPKVLTKEEDHPCFKKLNYFQANSYLMNKGIGDFIFRPNSRGILFLVFISRKIIYFHSSARPGRPGLKFFFLHFFCMNLDLNYPARFWKRVYRFLKHFSTYFSEQMMI